MTKRLTKDIREAIVASVLKNTSLDTERSEIENNTAAAAEGAMRAAQPAGFYDAIKGHPAEWFKLDQSIVVRYSNPLQVIRQAISDGRGWYGEIGYDNAVPYAVDFSPTEAECKKIFGKLHQQALAWVKKRDQARGELMAFLASQRTVEGVLKAMPELERHIPAVAGKVYPLVAPSNVLSFLTKLGFDAGVKETVPA